MSIISSAGAHATNVRVIKAVAKIGTSHYPEIMKKVWIVNAPWAFAAAWNYVDGFLRLEFEAAHYRMLRQAMMARRALLLALVTAISDYRPLSSAQGFMGPYLVSLQFK